MVLDPDDVVFAPDDVEADDAVAINNGAPYANTLPALRALVAYIQNLNIPESQTAQEIANALAADSSALQTLQNALEVLADPYHGVSNLGIPYTFEDVTDWVESAAGNPTASLSTIDSGDLDDDATFGPEWEQDSQTAAVTVYQRAAFRPRKGRAYRATVKGYVGGSNSSTLQAILAELNSSYAVSTANKASSQNETFTAANTLQEVTFTFSLDVSGVDITLTSGTPFVRLGASIGPDSAISTNCRMTEILLEDITEVFENLSATAIVALIAADGTALESLKDAIVTDFDAADALAIVSAIDASSTAEQSLASALAGNATAVATIVAAIDGLVPSGGTADQVLTKSSGTNYDYDWADAAAGAPTEVAGAPDADDDDSNTGGNGTFAKHDEWFDTTTGVVYKCADASTGAAIWYATNVQGGVIGTIHAWPASAIPSGFLECDGSAVSRTTYAALFAAIGTTFGVGDGSTTFNIPDLRGEFIRGLDNGRGVDAARALGSSQAEAVGDHQHQLPYGGETNQMWARVDSSGDPAFGLGDAFLGDGNADRITTLSTVSQSGVSYVLSDDPYSGTDGSGDNRPRNVALKYIIRAASTYDVADLTPNMPSASDTAAGAVELATQAEVNAGTDTARAVTPATLAAYAGAGSLVYIGEVEASNDASVELTDLDSAYVAYYFQMHDLVVASDNVHFHMRTSSDNGSTYDSGASDYDYSAVGQYGAGAGVSYVAASSADFIRLSDNQGSDTSERMSGEMWLYNPSAATRTRINWRIMQDYYTGVPHYLAGGGRRLADEAVDAVQFFAASGNIESGKILVWGLKA